MDTPTPEVIDIHRLLQTMVEKGASDLHLTVGSPPCLRINGSLYPLKTRPLEGPEIEALIYGLMNDRQKKTFEETNEVDMSFRWKGGARFRSNFFRQQGQAAAALRQIPTEVRALADLGLPTSANDLIDRAGGLILVTGPTGSGKSTTLASFIDGYNSKNRGHIITIEDPIEFVHQHKKCIVNQREIGSDTESFTSALKYVLRQDPDVVLIGEVRDRRTMEALLSIAETGHLAFATMHTNNAVQTIHRILDLFPAEQQDMVRTQVSFVLEGVISQQLIPRADGRGRALACEVLLSTPAIRNLIRENKTHQIYSQMQVGQTRHGMQTMNQCLAKFVATKTITREDATLASYDPEELNTLLSNAAATAAATPPVRR